MDALIMITQTPDYFLPSTACLVQQRLGLSDACAAFDVGLGCSGYPYGLWLAAMMLQTYLKLTTFPKDLEQNEKGAAV